MWAKKEQEEIEENKEYEDRKAFLLGIPIQTHPIASATTVVPVPVVQAIIINYNSLRDIGSDKSLK